MIQVINSLWGVKMSEEQKSVEEKSEVKSEEKSEEKK